MKQRRYPVNGRGPEGEDGGPGEGEGETVNGMGRGRRTLPVCGCAFVFPLYVVSGDVSYF